MEKDGVYYSTPVNSGRWRRIESSILLLVCIFREMEKDRVKYSCIFQEMEKVRIEYLPEYLIDRERDHETGMDDCKKWVWEVNSHF